MFFLIGGDGREYGPFSAEQIREWLAQGRANAHSRIRRDGDVTWQPLQDVAEFADVASVSPPPPGAPPPPLSPESIAAGLPGARRAGRHLELSEPRVGARPR